MRESTKPVRLLRATAGTRSFGRGITPFLVMAAAVACGSAEQSPGSTEAGVADAPSSRMDSTVEDSAVKDSGTDASARTDGGVIASDSGQAIDATTSSDAGRDAASLPACRWPTIYDAPDGSPVWATGQCVAARVLLSCVGSNGGSEQCATDNLTQCPGPNPTPGVTYSDCQNQCQSDEYVLFCGTVGAPQEDASVASTPPANCVGAPPNPGGREPSCCPCSP